MACLWMETFPSLDTMLTSEQRILVQLVAFYLATRAFNAAHYLWIGYLIPMVRGHMVVNAIIIAIPSALGLSTSMSNILIGWL